MTYVEDQLDAALAELRVPAAPAARRHVLDLDDWTPAELEALLSRAAAMRELLGQPERRLKTLAGRVLVNLYRAARRPSGSRT